MLGTYIIDTVDIYYAVTLGMLIEAKNVWFASHYHKKRLDMRKESTDDDY